MEAGPFRTSTRSKRKASSGRADWELVFCRIPSRMTVMSFPAKPREEKFGIEPTEVPPLMPTAFSTASAAVRAPRSWMKSWVTTETLAGSSRVVSPSREPVAFTSSSGKAFLRSSPSSAFTTSSSKVSTASGDSCSPDATTGIRQIREVVKGSIGRV